MKKFLIAAVLAVVAVVAAPKTVKADGALDAANNFAKVQNDWLSQQWSYYTATEVPVMTAYRAAMADQVSQALAAQFQSDVMARQAQMRAAVNSFQLMSNEYAHQQNLATQYTNLKNVYTYNAINNLDQTYYNNQEMVLRTYGMMMGQYPFPQVQ
ncbi:MAG: hypothetical protein Q4D29_09980 [Lachnospiraceae bacterium]|nr:hypothetical protein [Lachnospiraceae bacterium]